MGGDHQSGQMSAHSGAVHDQMAARKDADVPTCSHSRHYVIGYVIGRQTPPGAAQTHFAPDEMAQKTPDGEARPGPLDGPDTRHQMQRSGSWGAPAHCQIPGGWMALQPDDAEVIERQDSREAPSPSLQGVQNWQDAASCCYLLRCCDNLSSGYRYSYRSLSKE